MTAAVLTEGALVAALVAVLREASKALEPSALAKEGVVSQEAATALVGRGAVMQSERAPRAALRVHLESEGSSKARVEVQWAALGAPSASLEAQVEVPPAALSAVRKEEVACWGWAVAQAALREAAAAAGLA